LVIFNCQGRRCFFSVASSLVPLNSEIESRSLFQRFVRLDDSISQLHKQVPALSKIIYQVIKKNNSTSIVLPYEVCKEFVCLIVEFELQKIVNCRHAPLWQFTI
jgi:hypothetical protein